MGDPTKANFTLNTDVPLTMVNSNGTVETMDFEDINFNGDADEAASNLQENQEVITGTATLKDTSASFEGYRLKIIGTFRNSRRLRYLIQDGGQITMNVKSNEDETKTYQCNIKGVTDNSQSELSCDTTSNPLTTTEEKLHLSSGNSSDGTLLSIEMANPNSTSLLISGSGSGSGGSRSNYQKSSSGLSGGAIAGIVIACVVALAAASIAAIMLRKPTPPPMVDNTTVVGIKDDNI